MKDYVTSLASLAVRAPYRFGSSDRGFRKAGA